MKQLEVLVRKSINEVHIDLEGDLTLMDALNFKHSLNELNEGQDVILDLNKIKEIDLTGLNALLMLKLLCSRSSRQLTIYVYDGHPLYELLELTKFKNQFSFRNSIAKMELVA